NGLKTDATKGVGGKRNRTDLDESLQGDVSVKIRGKTAQSATTAKEDNTLKEAEPNDETTPVTLRVVSAAEKMEPANGPSDDAKEDAESALRVKNPNDRKKEAAERERAELMRKMNEATPAA